jgi:signal transduction histidine kinase
MTVCASEGTAILDPAVIGRILDNLLTNAIRHASPGGAVTLGADRGSGLLTLTVADTGAGVAPAIAARLFEPFVTGRPDGTGLGLAIARELADAHGGRLLLVGGEAASGGAVFALELPQEGSWPPS